MERLLICKMNLIQLLNFFSQYALVWILNIISGLMNISIIEIAL